MCNYGWKFAQERRKINAEINTFRRVYQRPEDRRDYDLYDPDRLKKSLPARTSDEDPRLGPASAQKYEKSIELYFTKSFNGSK